MGNHRKDNQGFYRITEYDIIILKNNRRFYI